MPRRCLDQYSISTLANAILLSAVLCVVVGGKIVAHKIEDDYRATIQRAERIHHLVSSASAATSSTAVLRAAFVQNGEINATVISTRLKASERLKAYEQSIDIIRDTDSRAAPTRDLRDLLAKAEELRVKLALRIQQPTAGSEVGLGVDAAALAQVETPVVEAAMRIHREQEALADEIGQQQIVASVSAAALVTFLLILTSVGFVFPLIRRLRSAVREADIQRQSALEANEKLTVSNELLLQRQSELNHLVSEQSNSLELLSLSASRFQNLFHGFPFPCFSIDLEGNLCEWNQQAESAFGHFGFFLFEVPLVSALAPEGAEADWTRLSERLTAGERVAATQIELRHLDGTPILVEVHGFPLLAPNGKPTGAVISAVDIREREAQRHQVEWLGMAVKNTEDSIAVLDEKGAFVFANSAFESLTGRPSEALRGILPTDVLVPTQHDSKLSRHLRAAAGRRKLGTITEELRRADGTTLWASISVTPVRGSSENGTGRFVLVVSDCTDEVEMNSALTRKKEMIHAGMEALTTGMLILDGSGRVEYFNPAAADILGELTTEQPPRARDVLRLKSPIGEDLVEDLDPIQQCLDTGARTVDQEVLVVAADESEVPNRLNVVPIRHNRDGIVGAVVALENQTELLRMQQMIEQYMFEVSESAVSLELHQQQLEEANAQLAKLSITDGLTGVFNHRYFRDELRNQMEGVSLEEGLSVLLVDIDRFKSFNDDFGHQVGDRVLREVAAVLVSTAPEHIVARYGGEEFAVLMVGSDAVQATALAERICKALRDQHWDPRPVTTSIGIATTHSRMLDSDLIEWADQALYECKRGGRDQARHWDTLDRAAA